MDACNGREMKIKKKACREEKSDRDDMIYGRAVPQ